MTTVRTKEPEHVEEEHDLTEEQEAELEEAMAEIERGEWIDGDEVQRELRRRRGIV
jgi:predicted transcriptional regulator